jgi:hypothetical protein
MEEDPMKTSAMITIILAMVNTLASPARAANPDGRQGLVWLDLLGHAGLGGDWEFANSEFKDEMRVHRLGVGIGLVASENLTLELGVSGSWQTSTNLGTIGNEYYAEDVDVRETEWGFGMRMRIYLSQP